MTSGRGILHEEMPRRGPSGAVNGFQLWVNLPAAEKMGTPRYQEISAESIPAIDQDGARVRVVAGLYQDVKGPVTEIAARPIYIDVTLEAGASFRLPIPEAHRAVAYAFEGQGVFGLGAAEGGTPVQSASMVVFGQGDGLEVQAAAPAGGRVMLMAGAPARAPG